MAHKRNHEEEHPKLFAAWCRGLVPSPWPTSFLFFCAMNSFPFVPKEEEEEEEEEGPP
jgi:hypothetical protein